jgi:hypothetical protein
MFGPVNSTFRQWDGSRSGMLDLVHDAVDRGAAADKAVIMVIRLNTFAIR